MSFMRIACIGAMTTASFVVIASSLLATFSRLPDTTSPELSQDFPIALRVLPFAASWVIPTDGLPYPLRCHSLLFQKKLIKFT